MWHVVPTTSLSPFLASPALSPDGHTLYVANSSDTLFAFDVATGAPVITFGSGGQVALPAGTRSSPLVDAARRQARHQRCQRRANRVRCYSVKVRRCR